MIEFINHIQTLSYFDGPEVFEAQDFFGTKYIGVAVEAYRTVFKFLVIRVEPHRLNQLRRGEDDLLRVVLDSSKYGWFVSETDSLDAPIPIDNQCSEPIPSDWLPRNDYYICDPLDQYNTAMPVAIDCSNFVVHIKFEPKNTKKDHQLNLKHYGKLILELNSLVVCAGRTYSSYGETIESSKLHLDVVTPASKGSLVVLIAATTPDEDLFEPHRLLVHSLNQIDSAISTTKDTENIKTLSSDYGVEFAKKFMLFMEALNRCRADFRYSWAEPRFQSGNTKRVSLTNVETLLSEIAAKSNDVLSEAERTINGTFVQFTRKSGKWGLDTDQGLIVGVLDDDELPTMLDGLVVGSLYLFECIERQSFDQAWKDKSPTLILRRIVKL